MKSSEKKEVEMIDGKEVIDITDIPPEDLDEFMGTPGAEYIRIKDKIFKREK